MRLMLLARRAGLGVAWIAFHEKSSFCLYLWSGPGCCCCASCAWWWCVWSWWMVPIASEAGS